MHLLKNPLTTQRFATWLNYIQTGGNFGYNCFLTSHGILCISEAFFSYIKLQIQNSTYVCFLVMD